MDKERDAEGLALCIPFLFGAGAAGGRRDEQGQIVSQHLKKGGQELDLIII